MTKTIYWVYILHCENDTYYTGYTTDLMKRYQAHCTGTASCKYTRSFKPIRIAQSWEINGTKSEAMKVEAAIKKLSRAQKLQLILQPALLSDLLPKQAVACFTPQAAKQFLQTLLEDVFPNGRVERAKDFYARDVIGHFDDEIIHFDDIEKRLIAIRDNTKRCKFEVKKFFVIGDMLAFRVKQSWVTIDDGLFNNLTLFGIYKFRDGKICEIWATYDGDNTPPYTLTNKNFKKHMLPYEMNQKTKTEFLQHLKTAQYLYGLTIKLSEAEENCLYYYFHGFSAKETAIKMDLSFRTVETYLAQIKDKFSCKTKRELRKKLFPDKN